MRFRSWPAAVLVSTAAALALPSLQAAAFAIDTSSIPSLLHGGERVRVAKRDTAKADPLIGIFRAATAESVEMDEENPRTKSKTRLIVPIDDLASIEVSRGRKHHTLAGALVGGLAGWAASAAFSSGEDEMAGLTIVIFVPAGVLMGAFAGNGIGSERWEKVWERPPK